MKISIIGAGNVGASAGLLIAEKNLCDQLVLIDIVESVKGKAKDIQQASPTLDFQTELIGSTDYKEIEGSDIIINTAGFPRKEGESRDDLLKRNLEIVKSACSNIQKYSPDSLVINVANPVDSLTYAFSKLLNISSQRVFGMGGLLDCSRAQVLISKETNIQARYIEPVILGTHGDTMAFSKKHSNGKDTPIE